MFARYWGRIDLVDSEQFWDDCMILLKNHNVVVPLEHNPSTVRRVLEILECPAGECGECCNYSKVPLNEWDIEKLGDAVPCVHKGDEQYIDASGGCPLLKDKRCSIYARRPDACYMFPIDTPLKTTYDGKPFSAMRIRLRCSPALKIIRMLITKSMASGKTMMLPDLTLLSKEK